MNLPNLDDLNNGYSSSKAQYLENQTVYSLVLQTINMSIRDEILRIRQVRNKSEFISLFQKNPEYLDELLKEILNLSEYPYKEYASWILVHLCKSSDLDIQKHYPDLIDVLFKTNDQTVLRNIVNCISMLKIQEYRESDLIDLLIHFIQDPKNKVALHVYSIYILIQFVQKYPELKSEISEIIAHNERGKSAAFQVARRNFDTRTKKI